MTQFNIEQLFTPAISGIGPSYSTTSPPADSWMAQNLDNAETVELDTTAWQPGSPTRSWLAVSAIDQAKQDAVISAMAQGGFLDWAASGTVTYTDPHGNTTTTAVSPDPSDPASGNATGAPTWLDALATQTFAVERIPASAATVTMSFANTSSTTPATYAVGTYHVQDATTPSTTYSNAAALSIAPSSVLGGTIVSVGTSAPLVVTTSSTHGLATGASSFIAGANPGSAANGFWQVTVLSPTTFSLNGSSAGAGSGAAGKVYSVQAVPFAADAPGPTFSAAAGDLTVAISSNSGVTVENFSDATGNNWESNPALAARCRLKLATISPGGASGAYLYIALTAYAILLGVAPGFPVPAIPARLQFGAVTRAQVTTDPMVGHVTVTVAPGNPLSTVIPSNGEPVEPGISAAPISGATNAAPIVVHTGVSHGLSSGNVVSIEGVLGNTAANGVWTITVVDATHFSLNGSSGNGAYTGGGQLDGGDLGLVDSVIQQYCVPDGDTAETVSGSALLVAIVGSIAVPNIYRAQYIATAQAALLAYVNSLPIGGLPLAGGGFGLPIDNVIGILYAAGGTAGGASYVQNLSGVTLNGSSSDLVFPSTSSTGVVYPAPNLTVAGL